MTFFIDFVVTVIVVLLLFLFFLSLLLCYSPHEKYPYSEFFGPYFPALGLNKESYSVSIRIQSECGNRPEKRRIRTLFTQ